MTPEQRRNAALDIAECEASGNDDCPPVDSATAEPSCRPAPKLDNETLIQVLLEHYAQSHAFGGPTDRWVECKAEVLKRLAATPALTDALAELRTLFPDERTIEIREDKHARYWADYPNEKQHSYAYGLVSIDDNQFRGTTLAEAMNQARSFAKGRKVNG